MLIFHFDLKAISKDNEKIMSRNGRYFLSNKYKQWERTIGQLAKIQLPKPFEIIEKDIEVYIVFYFADKRHSDLLNLPKSLCDSLTGIVWKDDKQIKSACLELKYCKNAEIFMCVI